MAPSMRFPFYCAMAIASAIGNCLSGLAAYLIRDWSTLQIRQYFFCLFQQFPSRVSSMAGK